MRNRHPSARSLHFKTNPTGLVLTVASEMGDEVVVDEFLLSDIDPSALLASLERAMNLVRTHLTPAAAAA